MNRVATGLLIGVGVVSGLIVLLMRGEKTQRFLRERWQQLRSALPEPEHVGQYAQQAMKKVRVAGSGLSDLAQQTSATIKQTGQDVAGKTKQMAKRG